MNIRRPSKELEIFFLKYCFGRCKLPQSKVLEAYQPEVGDKGLVLGWMSRRRFDHR